MSCLALDFVRAHGAKSCETATGDRVGDIGCRAACGDLLLALDAQRGIFRNHAITGNARHLIGRVCPGAGVGRRHYGLRVAIGVCRLLKQHPVCGGREPGSVIAPGRLRHLVGQVVCLNGRLSEPEAIADDLFALGDLLDRVS